MTFPIAIDFRGVKSPATLRDEVLERAARLEAIIDDVLACRVVVEGAFRAPFRCNRYGVYVRVAMPRVEIEAGGRPNAGAHGQDPYLTVEETFDVLTARVREFVRRRCVACARYRETHRLR